MCKDNNTKGKVKVAYCRLCISPIIFDCEEGDP